MFWSAVCEANEQRQSFPKENDAFSAAGTNGFLSENLTCLSSGGIDPKKGVIPPKWGILGALLQPNLKTMFLRKQSCRRVFGLGTHGFKADSDKLPRLRKNF